MSCLVSYFLQISVISGLIGHSWILIHFWNGSFAVSEIVELLINPTVYSQKNQSGKKGNNMSVSFKKLSSLFEKQGDTVRKLSVKRQRAATGRFAPQMPKVGGTGRSPHGAPLRIPLLILAKRPTSNQFRLPMREAGAHLLEP